MSFPQRQCLNCGMSTHSERITLDTIPPVLLCIKCDANLYQQNDGSCLTRDIAHQHETGERALQKLDVLLVEGWEGYCRTVRVVVGGGLIREQVLGQLHYYQGQRRLLSFREESPNKGAILVHLRS